MAKQYLLDVVSWDKASFTAFFLTLNKDPFIFMIEDHEDLVLPDRELSRGRRLVII